jgi:hypothetical protein
MKFKKSEKDTLNYTLDLSWPITNWYQKIKEKGGTTPAGSSWFPWIVKTGKPTLKWGSS